MVIALSGCSESRSNQESVGYFVGALLSHSKKQILSGNYKIYNCLEAKKRCTKPVQDPKPNLRSRFRCMWNMTGYVVIFFFLA